MDYHARRTRDRQMLDRSWQQIGDLAPELGRLMTEGPDPEDTPLVKTLAELVLAEWLHRNLEVFDG